MSIHKLFDYNRLANGEFIQVEINGKSLLVARANGNYYALKNLCSHQEQPFDMGKLEGEILTCLHHAVKYSIITGEVLEDSGFIGLEGLKVYPVIIKNGQVYVSMKRDIYGRL